MVSINSEISKNCLGKTFIRTIMFVLLVGNVYLECEGSKVKLHKRQIRNEIFWEETQAKHLTII